MTTSQPTTHDIQVEMVSDPTYLAGARELVSAVAKRLGFDDEACSQIALAVDEALCNVIRHGYDRRRDGKIWIGVTPSVGTDPGISIVIEDEAKQVDPDHIRGRDLDDIRPGGLGVHIIRQVMDTVRYEKRDAKGMRLVLAKKKPANGRGPEPVSECSAGRGRCC